MIYNFSLEEVPRRIGMRRRNINRKQKTFLTSSGSFAMEIKFRQRTRASFLAATFEPMRLKEIVLS